MKSVYLHLRKAMSVIWITFLCVGVCSFNVIHAEDEIEKPYDESEEVTDITQDEESDFSIEEDEVIDDETVNEEDVTELIENEIMLLDEPMVIDNSTSTIQVGETKTFNLNENEEALYRFDCPASGFYKILGYKPASDDSYSYGYGYIDYYNNVYYRLFGALSDGSVNRNELLGTNLYTEVWDLNLPKYANEYERYAYLEEGKTYYYSFLNNDWSDYYNPVIREITLYRCDITFSITNTSTTGGKRDMTLSLTDKEDVFTVVSRCYVFGEADELKTANYITDYSNGRDGIDRIHFSLDEGETIKVSVLMADLVNGLSWYLSANYDSDYTIAYGGDYFGTHICADDTNTYSMNASYSDDPNDTTYTEFHQITSPQEFVKDAHYVFVAQYNGDFYALAADYDTFMKPVSLGSKTLTDPYGREYQGYALNVSEKDMTQSDYVLKCTNAGSVSFDNSHALSTKFSTNLKNPLFDKKVSLKMGTTGSDWHSNMFLPSAGGIDIFFNENHITRVVHDVYARLHIEENAGNARFAWDGYNSDQIYILTDAAPPEKEELTGQQVFFRARLGGYELGTTYDLLITYRDPSSGAGYALTANGTVKLSDHWDEPCSQPSYFSDDFYPDYIQTDISNSFKPATPLYQNALLDGTMYDLFAMSDGLERNGVFLDTSKESLVSDVAVQTGFMFLQNAFFKWPAYSQSDFNEEGFLNRTVYPLTGNNAGLLVGFDKTTHQFFKTSSPDEAVETVIYIVYPGMTINDYHQVNDLNNIQDWQKIVLTYKNADGQRFFIHPIYGSLGLSEVGEKQNYVDVGYMTGNDTLKVSDRYAITPGSIKSTSNNNFKVTALTWEGMNFSLYVDGYVKNGSMLADNDKEAMFTYNDDGEIILRGAKNWLVYDETKNAFVSSTNKADATPIEIWALGVDSTMTHIIYHSANDEIIKDLYTEKSIDLMKMPDLDDYIFVGWSTDENVDTYLSLDDSCDLYDYASHQTTFSTLGIMALPQKTSTQYGGIKDDVREKYSLLGNCSPEIIDSISPDVYQNFVENKELNLYPVYARKSFDQVVTADERGFAIVGISDWKDLQSNIDPQTDAKQRWLGKVNVVVYLDGELWTDNQPLYFRYHNDDAADINIKFVDDSLVDTYTQGDQLHAFLCDGDTYPEESQDGHYKIDAVYASQGGSEDGLKYRLNWMSNHGGRLDNVEGGSTVYVYVTTLYQAEYYLNDVELTGSDYTNPDFYATEGSDRAFRAQITDMDFFVENKPENAYHALMDQSITDESTFLSDEMARGGYSWIAYHMSEFEHTIPLPKLPNPPSGEVLTDDMWTLKSHDDTLQTRHDAESDFYVEGGVYGTGVTNRSYLDGDDDVVPTFHFYIYSKPATSPVIPPVYVVPNTSAKH